MSIKLTFQCSVLLAVVLYPVATSRAQNSSSNSRLGRLAASPLRQEAPIRSPLYGEGSSSARPNLDPQTPTQSPDQTPGSVLPEYQDFSASRITSDNKVEIDHGVVAFIDDITLPALEPGAISSIEVEEGDFITAGTMVGRIDDTLLQKELELAKVRYGNAREKALSSVPVDAAKAESAFRESVRARKTELFRTKSVSHSEYEQAVLEAEIAKLKIDKAQEDRTMARGEAQAELVKLESVKHRLARHALESNYNAYVVEILAKPQEYVNVGDPVMRLGRMDQLWVQGNIRSDLLEVHEALHRPVTVELNLPGDRKEVFQGRVDQIGVEMHSSDNFRIKVRVENRKVGDTWLLRPLGQVKILVHLDKDVVAGK